MIVLWPLSKAKGYYLLLKREVSLLALLLSLAIGASSLLLNNWLPLFDLLDLTLTLTWLSGELNSESNGIINGYANSMKI